MCQVGKIRYVLLQYTSHGRASERWSIGFDLGLLSGRPEFESDHSTEILRSLSWFGSLFNIGILTLPLAETANILQCLALSMDEQYAVWYQHATKVPWLLAQKGFDDQ